MKQWILPDSLFVLEARDQEMFKNPDIVNFRARRKVALLVSQLRLDQIVGKVTISDEMVSDYYNEHYDTYKKLPGVIHITEVFQVFL